MPDTAQTGSEQTMRACEQLRANMPTRVHEDDPDIEQACAQWLQARFFIVPPMRA